MGPGDVTSRGAVLRAIAE